MLKSYNRHERLSWYNLNLTNHFLMPYCFPYNTVKPIFINYHTAIYAIWRPRRGCRGVVTPLLVSLLPQDCSFILAYNGTSHAVRGLSLLLWWSNMFNQRFFQRTLEKYVSALDASLNNKSPSASTGPTKLSTNLSLANRVKKPQELSDKTRKSHYRNYGKIGLVYD